ncbi:MAG: transcription elongation factor GreA, partial [Patescibacteria group bacterium]
MVLKQEKIPAIAARIDDARQLGDLSENAEYHSAKDEMAWAQTRLLDIEATLRNAQIIEKTSQSDTVTVGSSILVEWNDHEKTFMIVGPTEADPKQGKISNESPLGHAFLGKSVGETVAVD